MTNVLPFSDNPAFMTGDTRKNVDCVILRTKLLDTPWIVSTVRKQFTVYCIGENDTLGYWLDYRSYNDAVSGMRLMIPFILKARGRDKCDNPITDDTSLFDALGGKSDQVVP